LHDCHCLQGKKSQSKHDERKARKQKGYLMTDREIPGGRQKEYRRKCERIPQKVNQRDPKITGAKDEKGERGGY
jgi:hypothetical protein